MSPRAGAPLAPLTTLGIGGPARVFMEAKTDDDLETARGEAARRSLALLALGGGSNILVPDAGVDAVVVKMAMNGIAFDGAGDEIILGAGAGARWDDVVDAAAARGAWGIENLAGIPGTAGGAAVQNIGAYGAELAPVFAHADVVDAASGARRRVSRADAAFGYRASAFKRDRTLLITRIALRLSRRAAPNLAYADLARAKEAGAPLATPAEIAAAVRAIRSGKFPQGGEEGTAGSFFKNPIIPAAEAAALAARYPGLPVFPQDDGATAKVSLAWLLDRALALKGHAHGGARLYEKQPLVIVARAGATAADVDALAKDVAARVLAATGIRIEREVETFGARR
ncbi:MAG TPA: UDP-N-acetylmuramate dehydrogenase [Candidatus Paceibacterota bacterium]|nr:UDP-N-acetylmuramate dehydrogenase [Candidatus Paceibacterota bacterium]